MTLRTRLFAGTLLVALGASAPLAAAQDGPSPELRATFEAWKRGDVAAESSLATTADRGVVRLLFWELDYGEAALHPRALALLARREGASEILPGPLLRVAEHPDEACRRAFLTEVARLGPDVRARYGAPFRAALTAIVALGPEPVVALAASTLEALGGEKLATDAPSRTALAANLPGGPDDRVAPFREAYLAGARTTITTTGLALAPEREQALKIVSALAKPAPDPLTEPMREAAQLARSLEARPEPEAFALRDAVFNLARTLRSQRELELDFEKYRRQLRVMAIVVDQRPGQKSRTIVRYEKEHRIYEENDRIQSDDGKSLGDLKVEKIQEGSVAFVFAGRRFVVELKVPD